MNAPREDIARVADISGIDTLQLHGDETPADCVGFDQAVIKAFRIDATFRPEVLSDYKVRAYLFDTPVANYGGSGVCFDWSLLRGLQTLAPFILAGGLSPNNVGQAIRTLKPYAVDVASGVESAPGIKSAEAMRRFVAISKNIAQ